MIEVLIRNAELDDLGFILAGVVETANIERASIEDKRAERKRIRKAMAEKRIRIADANSRPVGFIWFVRSHKSPYGVDYEGFGENYYWVEWVFVKNGHRGRGIGTALYKDLFAIAKRHGVKKVLGDIFRVNKRSAKFHQKLGFMPMLTIYYRPLK